jgi:hypothetical protein
MGIKKAHASKKSVAPIQKKLDEIRSGDYLFKMESELVVSSGKIQPQVAGHCFMRIFLNKNNIQGEQIPHVELRMSALPSAMKLTTHCSKVAIMNFNVDHEVPCTWTAETRGRLQESIMRVIFKMYDETIRITTNGFLEYQGLTGEPACYAMASRFGIKFSTKGIKELVVRQGKFYTERRISRCNNISTVDVAIGSCSGDISESEEEN